MVTFSLSDACAECPLLFDDDVSRD